MNFQQTQITPLYSGPESITCVHVFEQNVYLGMRSGLLKVISSFNFISQDIQFDSCIISVDQLGPTILVGTQSGLFQVDSSLQKYVRVFPNLKFISKIHLLNENQALVSAQSGWRYPELPQQSRLEYQERVPGWVIYNLDLKFMRVNSQTEPMSTGGYFCVHKDQLLVPLNAAVERDFYCIFSFKNNFALLNRGPGIDCTSAPISCSFTEEEFTISFNKETAVYKQFALNLKSGTIFQSRTARFTVRSGKVKAQFFGKKKEVEIDLGAEIEIVAGHDGGLVAANGQEAVWVQY
ncbi:Hypothetical_protein [Hexamita inflata]|uniref:Hypothetical_protein n=1 Tax=Hexamita inflata TaxID=28002 RepID=A0AA86TR19_9EUKA|nr:Hypothetical protein HINF_LOCUS13619 [Hexamita inflata]CAI9925994.1 Hypothetical protein HINF_LOCUS13639 [Hexamita inflata]CAI9933915.1 Hypothetical protein HINF_LOCUS21560 [Hexamita inflata]